MSGATFDQVLFFVFFVYGLAFFGMGLTLALESGRSPALAEARVLRPLAAFGLIHGTHEWLESYILQAEAIGTSLPAWLSWFRLGLLALSFIALLAYSLQAFRQVPAQAVPWKYWSLVLLAVYVLFIAISAALTYQNTAIPWGDFLDVLARYLLAVPAAIWAALALQTQGKRVRLEGRKSLGRSLTIAAAGFALYSVTQIFVRPIEMFPATVLNAETFRYFAGFPPQIIRTVMAVLITLSLLRATQVVERERQEQLSAAQQARLEALEQIQVELTKRATQRRELLRHIVRVQEDERARIARELHDETAQILTAFSLDLATLQNAVPDRSKVNKLVHRLQALSKQMSQGLYRLVHDLRPAQLDDLGLVPALEYLQESSAGKGLEVSIQVQGEPKRLDSVVETVLFRVAQESLNNVARHAHTREAFIELAYEVEEVILRVTDSGAGFNPLETFSPPRGWGLAGMRERVESVSGQLHIESAPGKGTTIEVIIRGVEPASLPEERKRP